MLQNEWVLLEMGFAGKNFATQFLVVKYLQFWGGDFALTGVVY